jgi:hypothetical protein
MEAIEMQQQFFNLLKNSLPSTISMADVLAEKMGLSYDSIYRRIRGEKPLTMAELQMLCREYNISLDQVMQLKSDAVVFNAPDINTKTLPFEDYIKGMLGQLKRFNHLEEKKMRYLCKDMTFFHFFLFPEIAAFKTFFWIKTIQDDPAYNKRLFSLADDSFEDCYAMGQQIIKEYNEIPSVELWNMESINSTISQIAYYRDAGLFANKKDMETVIDSFERTLDHLQLQIEKGCKFMPGDPETKYKASLEFYINEVVLGSNTILIESKNNKESLVTYSVLSYMSTKDPRFCEKAFDSFSTLLSRSTLISGTGEKERNRFFLRLKERINALRQ